MSHNIWIGKDYAASNPKILLLGESDYGETPTMLDEYIPQWLNGEHRDATFSRISNTFGSTMSRETFWHRVSFYNFVPGMVGPTRQHRPTTKSYSDAKPLLAEVLNLIKPDGVLILGIEQSYYSEPIVHLHGTAYCISPHPAAFGLPNERLSAAWTELMDTVKARG